MDIFGSKHTGKKDNYISPSNVSKEQDIAKQILEILAPAFGASLPVKLAIQASIVRTDSNKLHNTLIDVKNLLNQEI